ncbi:MAG: holo-ACP synthase [Chloroflexi bacterium]|nr:holo-ACP synthase [Chloroflexota bacterium]
MHDHQRADSSLVFGLVNGTPTGNGASGLIKDTPTVMEGIQALGIDLVEVRRLQALERRWGEQVLTRLFTEQELWTCRKASGGSYRWQSLAGRFGAKEATKKVLAVRGEVVRWQDVEVLNGYHGEPLLRLYRQANEACERLGYQRLLLSISHDRGLAIAIVIAV